MTTAALSLPRPAWRFRVWSHPEWWALSLSAAAWLFLVATAPLDFSYALPSFSGHASHAISNSLDPLGSRWLFSTFDLVAIHWPPMLAAMMFPTLIGQLRFIAARSLWARRNRALVSFLAGYSALWLFFGFVAETLLSFQQRSALIVPRYVLSACFLLAALWQLSPQKRRSLVACHLTTPLCPSGWRADLDCFRHGLRVACSCCVSCWALMLVCAASGHALWAIVAATAIAWSERSQPRPPRLSRSLALFAFAALALIAAG